MALTEATKRQFNDILDHVAMLRRAAPKKPARIISAAELLDGPLLQRGEPAPDATAAEAYEDACRFWAEAVAPTLTYDEWDELVEWACEKHRGWPGDVIRFAENLFEMLTLADGFVVVA